MCFVWTIYNRFHESQQRQRSGKSATVKKVKMPEGSCGMKAAKRHRCMRENIKSFEPEWKQLCHHTIGCIVRRARSRALPITLPNENFLNYLVIAHHNIIIINIVGKLLSTDSTDSDSASSLDVHLMCTPLCQCAAVSPVRSTLFGLVIVQLELKHFYTYSDVWSELIWCAVVLQVEIVHDNAAPKYGLFEGEYTRTHSENTHEWMIWERTKSERCNHVRLRWLLGWWCDLRLSKYRQEQWCKNARRTCTTNGNVLQQLQELIRNWFALQGKDKRKISCTMSVLLETTPTFKQN